MCNHDPSIVHSNVYTYTGTERGEPLPAWAWPGGYPIYYLDANNDVLCAPCASKAGEYSACIVAADVYYEGPDMQCENCNATIASAYGDPYFAEEEG